MKKWLLAVGIVALGGAPVMAQEQGLDAGWAETPPTLDGQLSEGEWDTAMVVGFDGSDGIRPGVTGPDSGTIGGDGAGFQDPSDSSAVIYVMNDADNLYIAVDATDDVLDFSLSDLWRNDSVEIRIDGNFSRLTAKEGDMFGHSTIVLGNGEGTASAPEGDWESAASVKPDDSGWIVEYRTSTEGFESTIGFDVAINDSDDPNNDSRDGQYRWNGAVDGGWNDETQWGTLTLATEPGVRFAQTLYSPEAASVPELDGTLADGEWDDALVIGFDGKDGIRPGVTGPDSDTIGGDGAGFQDPSDSSTLLYIKNDANNFYVAVDVTDDILDFSLSDLFRNDSIEVRVDGNFSLSNPKEGDIFGHSTIVLGNGEGTGSEPSDGDWSSGAATKPDGSGWIAEYRTSTDGFEPVIGFDVAINDSDDPNSDSRDGQYRWNGDVDGGWNDETQWGKVVLFQFPSAVDQNVWELY